MTRVMIAIDGTDQDGVIAEVARRLFGDDADFWAVNVQPAGTTTPVAGTDTTGWATAPAMYGGAYPYALPNVYAARPDAEEVEDARRRARSASVDAGLDDAALVAEVGDPADAIRRAATEHDADVIVVGTHDRGWWSKLVQPSVSGDLVDDSPVPVLLVREEPTT